MKENNWLRLTRKNLGNIVVSKLVCYLFFAATFMLLGSPLFSVVMQAAMLILYLMFVYSGMHKEGAHDRNFVDMGKMKKDLVKSLIAGGIIALPSFISWILLVIFKLSGVFTAYYNIFLLFNAQYSPMYFWIKPGFVSITAVPWTTVAVSFFLILLLPAASFFGYLFGYKEIYPLKMLIYKDKNKDESED